MRSNEIINSELINARCRLEAYLAREREMLTGVQSYSIGSRSLTRYNTELAEVRGAIRELLLRDGWS